LTEYFKLPDSRIDYKTFCDTVENVFNIPDMEKKPLAYVKRPPQGLLAKVKTTFFQDFYVNFLEL
jgi:hypothetical protein